MRDGKRQTLSVTLGSDQTARVRLRIVAVGRLKEPHWRAACAEYLKRLRPYATVEMIEVADRDIGPDTARAVAAEGADLLRAVVGWVARRRTGSGRARDDERGARGALWPS